MTSFEESCQDACSVKENLLDGFAHHQVIYDDTGRPVDYKFLDVNDSFARLTGLKKEEVIGRTVTEVLPGIETSEFDWIGKYGEIAEREGKDIIQAYSEPLGRWYEITAYSDRQGYFTTIFRDITDLKKEKEKMEKAMEYTHRCQEMTAEDLSYKFFTDTVLELSEADFAFLNLISPEDENITITRAFSADSDKYTRIKNLIDFDLEGAKWPTDDKKMKLEGQGQLVKFSSFKEAGYYDRHASMAKIIKKAEKTLQPGEIFAMEISHKGEPLGVITLVMPKDKSLKYKEIVEMYINQIAATIKRLRAESDYQQKIEEQALLLDYTNFQVWFLKDTHTYGAVNKVHAEFMGMEKDEISNKSLYELLDEAEAEICEKGNRQVFEQKEAIYSEEWVKNSEGEPRLLSILKAPKLDSEGNVAYVVCSAEDITEKKQLEEELKSSHERYKNIVNSQRELICRFKADTTITFANQAYMDYFGFSEKDLYRKKFLDFIPEEEHELVKRHIEKLLNNKKPVSYDHRVITKGETKWQRWTDHPIFDERGHITEIQSFGIDITELKQTENELERMQEAFNKALEATNDGVWDWNVESGETYFSDNYFIILGYEPGEFEAHLETWRSMIHPEDRRTVEQALENMFTGIKETFQKEYRLKTKSGSYKWVKGRGKVVETDHSGYPKRIVGSNIDIHELKTKEKEMLRSQNLLEATLNAIPDIVGIQYPDYTMVRYNQAGYQFFGIAPEDVPGQKCYHLLGRATPCEECPTSKVLESGQPEEVEKHFPEEDIYLKIRSQPVLDENGDIEYIIEQIQNVTSYKMLLNALRKQNRLLDSILESIQDGITVINADLTIRHVNSEMESWHESARPLEGKACYWAYHGRNEPCENCPTLRAFQTGAMERAEFNYRNDYGNRWIEIFSYPMREGDSEEITGVVEFIKDITERKRAERQIRYLSFHDSLTGLYNRAYLEQEMKRLNVERQLPLSVIVADVNGLKLINDTYGHREGDKLLVEAAELLKKSCREEDIVARWGGDEFVILLPQTPYESAEKVTERIEQYREKMFKNELVSIAVGAATKEKRAEDLQKILKEAENKMYEEKTIQGDRNKNDVIHALLSTLKVNSEETEAHVERMYKLARALGKNMSINNSELEKLSLLAPLHDIGEVALSKDILKKPGKLTAEEWQKVKAHPEIGKRIAMSSHNLHPVAEEIAAHHERWDGHGYPHGLKREEIPVLARIIAIVDAYDVMTNGRAYKQAVSKAEALQELKREAGKQFDPKLVDKFIELAERGDGQKDA